MAADDIQMVHVAFGTRSGRVPAIYRGWKTVASDGTVEVTSEVLREEEVTNERPLPGHPHWSVDVAAWRRHSGWS
jgi:hypothetical protein